MSCVIPTMADHQRAADEIIERCKHLPIDRIRKLVHTLASALDVTLPLDRVIVNWDEVREMSRGGVSFGSHSCTHRIMTTITLDEVSEELVRSRQVLFDQGVNFVPVYCYPNGNSDASIEDLVKAHGYEAAVSVRMGFEGSCPKNRYAIRRGRNPQRHIGHHPAFFFPIVRSPTEFSVTQQGQWILGESFWGGDTCESIDYRRK
jgi:peptidoglycan/xylan/chitin deacetylase (PgdA/CDA1 family)